MGSRMHALLVSIADGAEPLTKSAQSAFRPQKAGSEYGQSALMLAQDELPGSQSTQRGQVLACSQPQPQLLLKPSVFGGQE